MNEKQQDKEEIEKNIYFKNFVKRNVVNFYKPEDLISDTNVENIICPICYFVLNEPINCSDNKNSHYFCKECIDIFLKESNKCPTCKQNFEYKINEKLKTELKELSFKCMFKNEGCNDIIPYSEYLNHINNCKYTNRYECQIKKYNYYKKEFEKCGHIGNKMNLDKHYKLCAFIQYKCIFCNESILKIDIKEHVKNKCKLGIYKYINNEKYIYRRK